MDNMRNIIVAESLVREAVFIVEVNRGVGIAFI